MSVYSNFLVDFPNRTCEILNNYYTKAKASDLEVTLMLSIATSGFIIPFERLRNSHPSGDSKKFLDAKKKLKKLEDKKFIGSSLWKTEDTGSWKYVAEMNSVDGKPESWPQLRSAASLPTDKKNNRILRHLRNALAHGNIFTTKATPIEQLIFLSRTDEQLENNVSVQGTLVYKYNESSILSAKLDLSKIESTVERLPSKFSLLAVSPDDFHEFLKAWFNFLKTIELPSEVIQEKGVTA